MIERLAVVAIGGNSLIKRRDMCTVADQYRAICATAEHVADLIDLGWRVVVTHGNGPQVGFIMLRSEIAREVAGLHIVPLVSCVADTQGALGYQIQQALNNTLARRCLPEIRRRVVTLITQVCVAADDPGFADPDKPIGEFYTSEQLPELTRLHPDWILKEDAQRGFRRVVPSPVPVEIVELSAINALVTGGFHVVAAGGGGIPVVATERGLEGCDAVIDKDLTSSLLATALGAELLTISTAVEQVSLNYGTPLATTLGQVSAADMERFLDQGHFAPGSMAPKIRAALNFIKGGGRRVVITGPEHLADAISRGVGTHIIP
ncbi:carbamate kinase-like protein YahI [Desulfovibrionales bacterium]